MRALDRAAAREEALVEQLLDQQRRLVTQSAASSRLERRSQNTAARSASLRSLGAAGDITVAELRALLEALPSGAPVVGGSRSANLAASRLVPAAWRQALLRLDLGDAVTVGDVLGLLDELDLPSGATVPTDRLFELLS